MTGVGGGVLLLPILIFVLRVPPLLAVGSDALFNFLTRISSSYQGHGQAKGGAQSGRPEAFRTGQR
jgi:uncharacterized membrane protein YfcA